MRGLATHATVGFTMLLALEFLDDVAPPMIVAPVAPLVVKPIPVVVEVKERARNSDGVFKQTFYACIAGV